MTESLSTKAMTVAECQAYLRERIAAREPVPCPVCSRTVRVARRRINASQAETFLAIFLESRRRASGARPWIHVEHELIREGKASNVGRDWAQLRHWKVIEPKTSDRNPSGTDVGLWRLTDFGVWVAEHPRRELLPRWVDTWNGKAWAYAQQKVSLVSCLGRSFDFEEEMRRAS